MSPPTTLKWVLLALLGLAVAAAVAIAASNLASRQIGLASEPLSAGDALAPRAVLRQTPKAEPKPEPPTETTAPEPTAPEEPTTTSGGGDGGDDHGSGGHGADD